MFFPPFPPFLTYSLLQADIGKMLEKRRQLAQASSDNPGVPSGALAAIERERLKQMRQLALARHDHAEAQKLALQLEAFSAGAPAAEAEKDRLAAVNERNRKANLEAVRKAELAEAERKRMRRKLEGLSRTGTPDLKGSSRRVQFDLANGLILTPC